MQVKSESLFWKKKEFVSFILSVLVFFIHSYFAQDIKSDSLISLINHKTSYFFSNSITQFAVPMFFMLSAISFFKEYNPKKYLRKLNHEFSRWLFLICCGTRYGCFGIFFVLTPLFQN